ncbi:MAG TPA: hypothetical protein PKH43_00110 [Saprospiraceae bacterium]|nr:hypothetical protein [Saprospiraceae bacterium]
MKHLITILLWVVFTQTISAQSAQFTQVPLNTIQSNDGIPVAPKKVVRQGASLYAIFPEPNGNIGRLWKSDDDGASWVKLDLFPNEGSEFTLEQIHATASSLLIFSYKNKSSSASNWKQEIRAFRSTDGGNSVQEVLYVEHNGNFGDNRLIIGGVDEANGNLFFYYSGESNDHSTLYISDDDGSNWQAFYPIWDVIHKICGANGRYYAMSQQVIFQSDNPWFYNAYDNVWANGSGRTLLHCSASGNNLYFCNAKGQVISSTDGLNYPTQVQLPFKLSAANVLNGYWYFNSEGHFYRAPLSNPLNVTDAGFIPMYISSDNNVYAPDAGHFFADGNRLFWFKDTPLESTDGGLSWDVATGGYPKRGGNLKQLNNGLWLFTDVIFRSQDGLNWQLYRDATGLDEGDYMYYDLTGMGSHLYLVQFDYYDATHRKVLRSDDNGASWNVVWQGSERPTLYPGTGNDRILLGLHNLGVGTPAVGLKYSDDFGDSWQDIPGAANFLNVASKGDSIYYYYNQKVYYTHNLGQQWQTTSLATNFQYGGTVMVFPNGRVLLINNSTYIGYVSLDGGQTFSEMFDLQNFGTQIYASRFVQFDSLLIGYGAQGTFISANNGLNWIYFYEGPWRYGMNYGILNGKLYVGRSGIYNNSYVEPGLNTPLQPLLDQLNLVSTDGGTASGLVFYDLNGNCIQSFEPSRTNEVFVFQPGNYATSTDLNGRISRILPVGNYTLQYATPLYHDAICFNPSNLTITAGNQSQFTLGFKPNAYVTDLSVVTTGSGARPGMPTYLTIKVKNVGTLPVPAGTVLTLSYPDGPFTFTDAIPAPTSQTAGSISYSLPAVAPYTDLTFKVTLTLAPDPGLTGQTFYLSAGLNSNPPDDVASNNAWTWPVFVTNSYDPNDKTAFTSSPTGEMPLSDRELRYLIRFQNTGTDTAFRVVVVDTLSPMLDWATLKTLSTSHPYRLVMSDPGVASWRFDDIMLPDSNRNEPASHGFVYFSIKAREGVRIGDTLRNRAAIYFDFNDAVLTNQTITRAVRRAIYRELDQSLPLPDLAIAIAPNPVGEYLNWQISLPRPMTVSASVCDASGRTLRLLLANAALPEGENHFSEKIGDLPAGTYWLTVRSDEEQRMIPFVLR